MSMQLYLSLYVRSGYRIVVHLVRREVTRFPQFLDRNKSLLRSGFHEGKDDISLSPKRL